MFSLLKLLSLSSLYPLSLFFFTFPLPVYSTDFPKTSASWPTCTVRDHSRPIVTSTRSTLASISLSAFILFIITVQFVRRNCPPIYILFGPISSFFLVVINDMVGTYNGAVVYQILKLQELVIFLTLRYLYSDLSDRLMDESIEMKYFSSTFRKALVHFDGTWREQVYEKKWYRQCFVICLFSCTYFFNDYICLFWISTRSKIPYRTYCFGYCLAILLEFPKTIMKFHIYSSALDAATGEDTEKLDLQTWEVVLFCATVVPATICVHSVHIRAVVILGYRFFSNFGMGGSSVSTATKMTKTQNAEML